MADLRDMAAVILFCGGWRRQWLAQNAHFPEMPLAKKKKEKLKKYRPFTRLVRSSLCGKSAHCTRTHWVYAGKKKEKTPNRQFHEEKRRNRWNAFSFWNWPRPSLFFFYFVAWLPLTTNFLDIRKLVRYSFAFETNRIAPTFSLSFVIIQIGAFKCRSDQLSQRLLRTAMTKCSWPITNGLLFVRGRTQGKGTTTKKKKFICPRFVIVSSLLLFVVDRVHNILSRMAIAFIFVGLYLLVQGRSRLFLSLSCLCLLLRSFHLHLPPTDIAVAPHVNDDGHPALFEYRAHTRGRFVWRGPIWRLYRAPDGLSICVHVLFGFVPPHFSSSFWPHLRLRTRH